MNSRLLLAIVIFLAPLAEAGESCTLPNERLLSVMTAVERIAYVRERCALPMTVSLDDAKAAFAGGNKARLAQETQQSINILHSMSDDLITQVRRARYKGDYGKAYSLEPELDTMLDSLRLQAGALDNIGLPDLGSQVRDIVGSLESTIQKLMKGVGSDFTHSLWGNFSPALILNFKDEGDIENASVSESTTDGLGRVTGGVVRVERDEDVKAGVGLAAHVFPWHWAVMDDTNKVVKRAWALGPHVSVMPSGDDLVDVLGVGLTLGMIGDPHFSDRKGIRTSMNVSVGWFFDFDSLRLEDGFEEGQQLPNGESEVRLKEVTDEGWQFMVSFTLYTP